VRDCDCRVEKKRLYQLQRTGIPARYQTKTFADYDTMASPSSAAALMMAKKYVEQWPTNRSQGLLLTGPVGVGKTHLECCVLMECWQQWGASVQFVDLQQLFARIKASFDPTSPETEREILKPLYSADILAIDEVGPARDTDWNAAMTEQIINYRYNEAKATLFTANLANRPPGWVAPKPTRVADAYDFEARAATLTASATQIRTQTIGDKLGARLHSRLQEMCFVIEVDGPDQRAAAGRKAR
jgi:DNA replication protein DnaC